MLKHFSELENGDFFHYCGESSSIRMKIPQFTDIFGDPWNAVNPIEAEHDFFEEDEEVIFIPYEKFKKNFY